MFEMLSTSIYKPEAKYTVDQWPQQGLIAAFL